MDGILDGKELQAQLQMGWPGGGWQGYFSLGVLDWMSSETEACHSSNIVYLFILLLFYFVN